MEYTELYKPSPAGADVTLAYGYAEIKDAFNTPPRRIAPVPMLHSLAVAAKVPGMAQPASAKELLAMGPAANLQESAYPVGPAYWGGYWAADGDTVKLKVPPHAAKLYRGASTTFMNPFDAWGWQKVFAQTAGWGANSVRNSIGFSIDWDAPLAKTLAGPYIGDEPTWKRIDAVVQAGQKTGVMTILNHFWGAFRDFPADQYVQAIGPLPPNYTRRTVRMPDNSSRYWKMNPASRELLIRIWTELAKRYKDTPADAVSYDLQNEPAYVNPDDFNAYAADVTKAIRAVDRAHTIIVEPGGGWADPVAFKTLKATGDANTWYSYHRYHEHSRLQDDGWIYYPSYQTYLGRYDRARIEEVLLDTIRFGIVNNAPLHCGETGLSILYPARSADRWTQDFYEFCEKYDVHWSWWEYASFGYWRTGLVSGNQESPVIPLISRFMHMNERNVFRLEYYPHQIPLMRELP